MVRYPKFTRIAQNDLLEIADYISLDNPAAAMSVIEAIEETAQHLVSNPDIGRMVESNQYESIRSLPCGDFPIYQIFYLSLENDLTIVRILHGARDVPRLINN